MFTTGNNLQQYRIIETVKVSRYMHETIKRMQNNFFYNEGQKRYGDHIKLLFSVYHSGDLSKIMHIGSNCGK